MCFYNIAQALFMMHPCPLQLAAGGIIHLQFYYQKETGSRAHTHLPAGCTLRSERSLPLSACSLSFPVRGPEDVS